MPEPGNVAATCVVNVTLCPNTVGESEDVTVVVVSDAMTLCTRPAELLAVKFAEPLNAAVIVVAPGVRPPIAIDARPAASTATVPA